MPANDGGTRGGGALVSCHCWPLHVTLSTWLQLPAATLYDTRPYDFPYVPCLDYCSLHCRDVHSKHRKLQFAGHGAHRDGLPALPGPRSQPRGQAAAAGGRGAQLFGCGQGTRRTVGKALLVSLLVILCPHFWCLPICTYLHRPTLSAAIAFVFLSAAIYAFDVRAVAASHGFSGQSLLLN